MSTLSINQKKLIRSLARKKDRQELGLFLVEGDKMVREILSPTAGSIPCKIEMLLGTRDWIEEVEGIVPDGIEPIVVTAAELKQVSQQQEPNRAMALVHQMNYFPDPGRIRGSLSIGLENIQDPGNMGTIMRIADWFGIRDILCSRECVELYNPKLIQSTMGSFLRVRMHYDYLPDLIGKIAEDMEYPIFGSSGEGKNLYKAKLPENGLILMGNESRGLSRPILKLVNQVLSIPFHDASMHPESLNVATATAILCAEFRRQWSLK